MGRRLEIAWEDDATTFVQWYRKEKSPDVRRRLRALWLLRAGYGLRETAATLGVTYRTTQEWVAWYREGGVNRVRSHSKIGRGRPAWLTEKQQEQLRHQDAQGMFHTTRDAIDWVEKTFGVRYTFGGMYALLNRLRGANGAIRPLPANQSAGVP